MKKWMGVALAVWIGATPFSFAADELGQVPDFGLDPRENDVAVVIGIAKYRDVAAGSEFSDSDAKLMKDYLLGLGFRESKIQLLLNDRATRADFAKSIERWLPNNVKPDSRVFFYYSGHGAPDATKPEKPEAFLLPYDGDPSDLANTGYPRDQLVAQLGKLNVSSVMVVLDSCFSGSGGRSVLPRGARPLMSQIVPVGALPRNMAVITASQANQISTSDPSRGHGVLTYHFLKAVRDGRTGFGEIYKVIKPMVEDSAKALNVAQSPTLMLGDAAALERFQLADPAQLKAAKAKREKEAEAARLKAEQERKERESDASLIAEKKRLAEEKARMEQERAAQEQKLAQERAAYEQRMREQQARLEAEARAREDRQRRELEEERRRIQRSAPRGGGEATFLPPSF